MQYIAAFSSMYNNNLCNLIMYNFCNIQKWKIHYMYKYIKGVCTHVYIIAALQYGGNVHNLQQLA